MKANSNNNPGEFTKSRGKIFFNFNIVESEKTDEQGNTRTVFDYDYIEVTDKFEGLTGAEILTEITREEELDTETSSMKGITLSQAENWVRDRLLETTLDNASKIALGKIFKKLIAFLIK